MDRFLGRRTAPPLAGCGAVTMANALKRTVTKLNTEPDNIKRARDLLAKLERTT